MRIAGVLGADGVNATGEASFCSAASGIQIKYMKIDSVSALYYSYKCH